MHNNVASTCTCFVWGSAAIWGVCVMRPKSMTQLQRSSELIFLSAWPQAFEKCAPTSKLCFIRWFLCHLLGRIYLPHPRVSWNQSRVLLSVGGMPAVFVRVFDWELVWVNSSLTGSLAACCPALNIQMSAVLAWPLLDCHCRCLFLSLWIRLPSPCLCSPPQPSTIYLTPHLAHLIGRFCVTSIWGLKPLIVYLCIYFKFMRPRSRTPPNWLKFHYKLRHLIGYSLVVGPRSLGPPNIHQCWISQLGTDTLTTYQPSSLKSRALAVSLSVSIFCGFCKFVSLGSRL